MFQIILQLGYYWLALISVAADKIHSINRLGGDQREWPFASYCETLDIIGVPEIVVFVKNSAVSNPNNKKKKFLVGSMSAQRLNEFLWIGQYSIKIDVSFFIGKEVYVGLMGYKIRKVLPVKNRSTVTPLSDRYLSRDLHVAGYSFADVHYTTATANLPIRLGEHFEGLANATRLNPSAVIDDSSIFRQAQSLIALSQSTPKRVEPRCAHQSLPDCDYYSPPSPLRRLPLPIQAGFGALVLVCGFYYFLNAFRNRDSSAASLGYLFSGVVGIMSGVAILLGLAAS